jgi:iron complex transport system substrate-binding protein
MHGLGRTIAGTLVAALLTTHSAGGAHARDAGKQFDTSRIVVIGGALTEVVYALGQQARVVAVDSTSQYPESALKEKKNVGYMRSISTEGVLSMNPSLVIASDKAGPPEVVQALKSGPLAYIEVDDRPEPGALIERIRRLSSVLNAEQAGRHLIERVEAAFKSLEAERASGGRRMRILFVLSLRNGGMVVGGRGTAAEEMLTLAGHHNAAAAVDGFKAISDEALIEMAPEIVLTMSRSGAKAVRDEVLAMAAIRATPAAAEHRIIEVDGLRFLGFGPRAPEAAIELRRSIAEIQKRDKTLGQQ